MRKRVVIGVTTCLLGVFLLYGYWCVRSAHDRLIEGKCVAHLSMIGSALFWYKHANGSFPPLYMADANGKPMHSWRVSILPYMGYQELFSQYRFDEPWNSEHNRRLASQMPEQYRCPASLDKRGTRTNYLAVVGAHAAWHGDRGVTDTEIGDASAHFNTIMVVETNDSQVDWMEPRDMSFEDAARGVNASGKAGISSHHPDGANCVTTDGHVHLLAGEISESLLRWLLTVAPKQKERTNGPW